MTCKDFDEILRKYNYGYITLQKYEGDGDFIHPHVVDNDGEVIPTYKWFHRNNEEVYDRIHFSEIEINPSGGDIEIEGDDYKLEDIPIEQIQFYNTNWAYPTAYTWSDTKTLDDECGILLSANNGYKNICQLDYTEQALRACLNPAKYQEWLLEELLKEIKLFNEKHLKMFTELGFYQEENNLFKRGGTSELESEVYIVYKTNGNTSFYMHQNMFTGKLVWTKFVKNPDCSKNAPYTEPTFKYEFEVNATSTEDLKKEIFELFEKNGEEFWLEKKKPMFAEMMKKNKRFSM